VDFAGGAVVQNPPTKAGGFPGGSDSKGSACNAGDLGSIPGFGGFFFKNFYLYNIVENFTIL